MDDYYDKRAEWSLIPEYMQGAVYRYVMQGIEPGSFLSAVLENDLKGAFGRADYTNKGRIEDYLRFFYSHVPAIAWGSPAIVWAWIERGGMKGMEGRAALHGKPSHPAVEKLAKEDEA